MSQQLTLELFGQRPTPGDCTHELYVLDPNTDNPKSECDLTVEHLGHPTWTNCRKCGYCTLWEHRRG